MLLRMDLSAGTDSSSVSQEQPRRPHQNAEPQLIPRSGLVHRKNLPTLYCCTGGLRPCSRALAAASQPGRMDHFLREPAVRCDDYGVADSKFSDASPAGGAGQFQVGSALTNLIALPLLRNWSNRREPESGRRRCHSHRDRSVSSGTIPVDDRPSSSDVERSGRRTRLSGPT
jgi:hypothetical protein